MRAFVPACVLIVALGVTAGAQDRTVRSKTKVKADDAKTMVINGCLQAADGNMFMLSNATGAVGKNLTARTTVKTDVDRDETSVKAKTRAKVGDDGHAVGTAGATLTYTVEPRAGVNLASHIGEQVEITAVMLDPRHGDDDADVTVEERTKVDNEDAPDATVRSKTKTELPIGATSRLMAISVKPLASTCASR
jgi:hypothetical protein